MTFNVGVYIEGLIITDRKEIARNYLKNQFLTDFLGGIGFLCSIIFNDKRWMMLFLFHMFQLVGLFEHIDNVYQIQ